jgi:hypothetical protein
MSAGFKGVEEFANKHDEKNRKVEFLKEMYEEPRLR